MTLSISFYRPAVVLMLVLSFFDNAYSQSSRIDSLQNRVANLSGTKKADAINRLAFEVFLISLDKSHRFALEALKLSEQLHYVKGMAEANIYNGMYEYLTGNQEAGFILLKKGQRQANEAGDKSLEGYAFVQLGNRYRNLAQYDSAKLSYDQSFLILKDSLHPWQLSSLYRNLGKYYGLISDPDNEIKYLLRAWKIRERLNDKAVQIDALVLLSQWYAKQYDLKKAMEYLNHAEKLSNSDTQIEIQIDIKEQKAFILFQQGLRPEALKLYKEVKDYYHKSSLQHYVKLLSDIGYIFEELSNYEVSLKNYFEALKIAEEKGFQRERVRLQIRIGWDYYLMDQIKPAEAFTRLAIETAEINGYVAEEADAHNSYGNIISADSQGRYDEAITHFQMALKLFIKVKDKNGEANTMNSLGDALESKKEFKEAERYQLKGLAIHESIHSQTGMAWAYFALGRLYVKLGDLPKSLVYLNMAEETARRLGLGIMLIESYQIRKNILEQQGKLKEALQYTRYYEQLKDSVFNNNLTNRIANLQSIYELEKKDKEIELLQKNRQVQQIQIEIQEAQIGEQRIIIISVALGLVLISIVAYTLYWYFKKVSRLNRNIRESNEEIQAQSEELVEANSALTELNRQAVEQKEEIQAQAEELTESYETIAISNQNLEKKVDDRTTELKQAYKELDTFFYRSSHDFRRPLTTFMGLAEVAKITVKDLAALELFEKVNETARNLDKMLMKLQSVSDLGSQELIFKEVFIKELFELAVGKFYDDWTAKNIDFQVEVQLQNHFHSYPALIKIAIENLIENAIQFCTPEKPRIALKAFEAEGAVVIEVSDNGQGISEQYHHRIFDMYFRGSERSKGNGLGLFIVKKVVEKLNGRIVFQSKLYHGSTFTMILPRSEQNG